MDKENIIKSIIDTYKTNSIVYGSMYILPDGTLLDLGSTDMGHAMISEFINDFGYEIDYRPGTASKLLKSLGWIRLNTKIKFVDLTKVKPTNNQYEKLLLALDYMKEYQITTPTDGYRIYKDRISDDVVKLIKRYYACGTLYEKLESK